MNLVPHGGSKGRFLKCDPRFFSCCSGVCMRVHNRFGGMRDFAIFRGKYLGCELKTGAGCGKFNNQRERDFLFLWGWHARIVRESSGIREFSFVLTNNLLKL